MEELKKMLGIGTSYIYLRKDSRAGDLRINSISGVQKVINTINGYMRTPKIDSLNAAIDFINEQRGLNIEKKGLDNSEMESNAWLSGFIDADGSFYIGLRKSGTDIGRLTCSLYLAQRVKDKRGGSLLGVLEGIAKVIGKSKVGESRDNKKYYVQTGTFETNLRLERYLDKFKLKSGKYKDYCSWKEVLNMMVRGEHLTEKGRERIIKIKESMSGRK